MLLGDPGAIEQEKEDSGLVARDGINCSFKLGMRVDLALSDLIDAMFDTLVEHANIEALAEHLSKAGM